MSIPFTQYKRPHGRVEHISIARSTEVEELAERFMKAGGCYEAEVLTTGDVSITAVYRDTDVEIEICENGPKVPEAVDAVVRRSIAHIEGKAIP